MDRIGDGLKKIILAGIGAVAATGEKSQEIISDLVKKGELTVEQSKILNKELDLDDIKGKVKEKTDNVRETVRGAGSKVKSEVDGKDIREIGEMLKNLSKEQLGQIRSTVEKFQKDAAEEAEEAEAECEACEEEAPVDDSCCSAAEEIREATEEAAEEVVEKAENIASDAVQAAETVCEKAADAAEEACEKIEEAAEEIKAE